MNKLALWIATGFYSGYFPVAPGTAGSFVALMIYLLLAKIGFVATKNWLYYTIFLLLLTYLGIWSAGIVALESGKKDPPVVVIDEIVGLFYSFYLLPVKPEFYIAGFIIFRLLDVFKPPPAYRAQKLPGGIGILADDIIVGIYTCLILNLTRLL